MATSACLSEQDTTPRKRQAKSTSGLSLEVPLKRLHGRSMLKSSSNVPQLDPWTGGWSIDGSIDVTCSSKDRSNRCSIGCSKPRGKGSSASPLLQRKPRRHGLKRPRELNSGIGRTGGSKRLRCQCRLYEERRIGFKALSNSKTPSVCLKRSARSATPRCQEVVVALLGRGRRS